MRLTAVPPILRSGLLQGLGAAAGVLLGVVLARRLGPDGSGYVAAYRNVGDLFAFLAVFGLPQAFVFFMTNIRPLSGLALGRFALMALGGLTTAVGAVVAIYVTCFPSMADWSLIWIMVGGLGSVAVLLSRGLLLGKSISVAFDVVSLTPNTAALLICTFWPVPSPASQVRCIAVAYVLSGIWAIFVAAKWVLAMPVEPGQRLRVTRSDVTDMIAYGFWAWLAQVLSMVMVYVTYRAFEVTSNHDRAVGLFNVSLVVYNIVQGPLSLFVPALMRHWSGKQQIDVSILGREYGLATRAGNLSLMAALAAYLLVGRWLIVIVFGPQFAGAWGAMALLLVAALAGYHCRLISSMLYAHGQPRRVARGFIIRCAVVAFAIGLLAWRRGDAETAAEFMALAWATADWCAFLDMGISLRRVTKMPWPDIIGIRILRA